MTRTFTIISVFVFSFLVASSAKAEPVTNQTDLGRCIAECEASLKLICFDETNRDISMMCGAVESCKKLDAGDVSAASALLGACYEGVTNHCPSNCLPGDGTATTDPPVKKSPPKQVRRPPPRKDLCKDAGGFYITEPGGTEKFCYTHQAMYEHLLGIEARLAELERKAKGHVDNGEPVPFDLRRDYQSEKQLLMDIDRSLVGMNEQLHVMSNRIIEYARHFEQRLAELDGRVTANESNIRGLTGKVDELDQRQTGNIKPALTGWSVSPYFTVQAFDLYGETQYAGGLELGVYPSLATNGRHRLAINLGFGKAADYFEKSMVQHHLFGGYGYYAKEGSVAVGLGVNRYSLTDVQQGRLFWVGPQLDGKINLADLSDSSVKDKGTYLFLGARIGVGYRYGRHGILDPKFEPVQGRFDVPFTFSLGVQGIPIL
ncbi:MAG: hypothetical protein P1P90_05225 [Patescibacteria group bacterium]|nr:hypothetical protein [Patescibacteria group bacterium]